MRKERKPKELKAGLIWLSMSIIIGAAVISLSQKINGEVAFFDAWWPVMSGLTIMTLGLTNVHAWRESERTRKGAHIKVQFYRAIVITIICGMITYLVPPNINWIKFFLSIALYQVAIFTLVFDYLFNFYKGNKWSYFGTESVMDILNAKMPMWLNILLEVSLYILSIILFNRVVG